MFGDWFILLFTCYVICAGQSNELVDEYVQNITILRDSANNWTYPQNADSYFEGNDEYSACRDGGVFDFIIIGAGAAGSVLVNRLTEVREWRVLVLEAGKRENAITDIPYLEDYLRTTDYNWGYVTTPQKNNEGYVNQSSLYPAGKALGGSSVIYSMMYVRGNKHDYDTWEGQGNPGWSYEDVLPYFKKLEHANFEGANDGYHGTSGPLNVEHIRYVHKITDAFLQSQSEMGRDSYPDFDYNGENQLGFAYLQLNTINGTRDSAGRAFVDPVANRPNLNISLETYVLKIMIDPQTKTAFGVKYIKNGTCYCARASKEVILSAGAIRSPHILMLSGVGPQEHLEEFGIDCVQNLSVGYNLWNHAAYNSQSFKVNISIVDNGTREDVSNYLNGQGLYTTPAGAEALGFVNLEDPNATYPLIEYICKPQSPSNPTYPPTKSMYGYSEDTFNNVVKPQSNYSSYNIFVTLLHPDSRGTVQLSSGKYTDYPLVDPKSFSENNDTERVLAGVKYALSFTQTPALAKYGAEIIPVSLEACKHYTWNTDDFWRCMITNLSDTIHHYGGTCKMGPRYDKTAVVDHRLRVHGINNLRVADCSIIPITLSGHTNAPANMIGEKGADMIKEDHRFSCSFCEKSDFSCGC